MKTIADGLNELGDGYIEGRYGCDFECSSMHLGALMKGLHKLKFVNQDPPDTRFGDLCLVEVVEKLRTIKSPTWTTVPSRCCRYNGYYYGNQNATCSDCPKPHACSERTPVFGFEEFRLGVGETLITSTSNGALLQHAERLVRTLEGNVTLSLEQVGSGTGEGRG